MPRPKSRTHRRPATGPNRRRPRLSLGGMLSAANRRAHEQANRRGERRGLKSVRAAIAATDPYEEDISMGWAQRSLRWLYGLLLLPACLVSTWTFFSRFFDATVQQGFWQTPAFWYFATGCLLMISWLWSGLLSKFFLYLYVLGHELTHVLFVLLFRGKVSGFHVSTKGGYITTNKTNLLIALSPYFVPFWSLVLGFLYAVLRLCMEDLAEHWHLAFYALMGASWSFHMVWTLWMIPRDQPDLRENGTFFSLVIIYLANILLLIALFCAAEAHPLSAARQFAMEWLRNGFIAGDVTLRWLNEAASRLREAVVN